MAQLYSFNDKWNYAANIDNDVPNRTIVDTHLTNWHIYIVFCTSVLVLFATFTVFAASASVPTMATTIRFSPTMDSILYTPQCKEQLQPEDVPLDTSIVKDEALPLVCREEETTTIAIFFFFY